MSVDGRRSLSLVTCRAQTGDLRIADIPGCGGTSALAGLPTPELPGCEKLRIT